MAYRRRPGGGAGGGPRPSTSNEEFGSPNRLPSPAPPDNSSSSSSASSLAAKAIRASSSYRDASLSSAYGQSALSPSQNPNPARSYPPSVSKDSASHEYTSMKNLSEPKHGFWGGLARKAKAIIDDDNDAKQSETPGRTRPQTSGTETRSQYHSPNHSHEGHQKTENPALQKGLGAITSSLTYIGGTIGNAFEEGLNIVENRTADIIQETRKLQIRKKGGSSEKQKPMSNVGSTRQVQQPLMRAEVLQQMDTDLEIQLKASRDVAMAMAAKAKLLLRELKTVKADLAFAKDRCGQLEEENRILRESLEKGDNPEDEDLIRLQLESLLAEKARLAQENSVFARENRFLREIVEYHQLTMQDVVYLDEGSEQVTEVYPIKAPSLSNMHSVGATQTTASPSAQVEARSQVISPSVTPLSSFIHLPEQESETRSDPA
ncbi:hypothetical protein RHMOL_Rhmol01G0330600 [Rhododendron molle]|uniref:Uncharacterized protein n=2 Tax=Rhododendron molle TaxID=49168 RepID=A0ACC0QBM4_RHOML|nr:hypothetical protein RHMOL_Rhmol01G0330600 [Rhododendron molle]KAI8574133.1 hypothetical protein RHMOL_Rhmol01G0330600 [Rhododendron molle]